MLSLKEQYLQAEQYYNQHKNEVSESLQMKLYGLAKQAKEGDCRMPMPPSTNVVLRAKWDNWTACMGMATEKALYEYVAVVQKIQNQASARTNITLEKATSGTSTSGNVKRNSITAADAVTGTILKQGTLYKQRDVFKGWRPRHFVLVDYFLQYYIEVDDALPRNTLDLTGCTVSEGKPVTADGTEYFPFTITHPKNNNSYKLSTTSQLTTEEWVAKIKIAIGRAPTAAELAETSEPSSASSGMRLLGGNMGSKSGKGTDDESTDSDGILHSEATLANVPKQLSFKIEMAVQALLDATQPNCSGWEIMYEKKGVTASKRPGDHICVKGESVLPYHMQDVWDILGNVTRQVEVDPQQRLHEIIRVFSGHSRLEYVRFKEVWPTSPRDFVMLVHWRMMADNTVILTTFSEVDDNLRPEYDGVVRGEIILAGYVLKPVPSGTQIHYIAQTDLKGKLPSAIVNMVCRDQPLVLANIKALLDKNFKGDSIKRELSAAVVYEDLVEVIHQGVPDTAKGDGSGGNIDAPHAVATTNVPGIPSKPKAVAQPIAVRKDGTRDLRKPPKAKNWREKLNAVALLTLFLPPLLYYIVDSSLRAVAFLVGVLVVFRYLIKLNIGSPMTKVSNQTELMVPPGGRTVINIPIDLGLLLRYLDAKREQSGLEITITHITLKACAMVIAEMPSINGHIMNNNFYRSRTIGIDMSMSMDITDRETGILKITDVDAKPIDYLSDEILKRVKTIRDINKDIESGKYNDKNITIRKKIMKLLPSFIGNMIDKFLNILGTQYGLEIPALDVKAFPLGCCCVLTSPNRDGETDVEVSVLPNTTECSTPIIVTIGSLKVLTTMDGERKLTGAPVLNYTVSFDNNAGSMSEYRRFVTKLKKYLNDPSLLDRIDEKAAFQREERNKRKEIFG